MFSHEVVGPSFTMQLNLATIIPAYIAYCVHSTRLFLTFISQLSERINYYTKYYVQQYDNHHNEKQQVKNNSGVVFFICGRYDCNCFSDSSSHSKPLMQCTYKATEYGFTIGKNLIFKLGIVKKVFIEKFLKLHISPHGENIDSNY